MVEYFSFRMFTAIKVIWCHFTLIFINLNFVYRIYLNIILGEVNISLLNKEDK